MSKWLGQGGAPPSAVADAMIDAVIDFVKKKKGTNLQNVKFLIFQTTMLSDFHESMLKRQQKSVEEEGGIMGWLKGMWMNPVYHKTKIDKNLKFMPAKLTYFFCSTFTKPNMDCVLGKY